MHINLTQMVNRLERLAEDCGRTQKAAVALCKLVRREVQTRPASGKLQLTWVAKLKQWRKRRNVDGETKTFYLGSGLGKDDAESYARAMAKWLALEKTLPETKALHLDADLWNEQPGSVRTAICNRHGTKTLASCIDGYVADQQKRYEHGLKFPDAPQRERISGVRFISYRFNAHLIKADWGDQPIPSDEATLAALMKRFREGQKALMTAGKIQAGTVNERMKTLRHLVRWMHEQYLVPELPRDMLDLCSMYSVPTSAKALDLDVIHLLWNAATSRFKTYMALALNCGFYATDIAFLRRSHIQGGYISTDRHKTGVPTRFKLWAVTRELLGQNCALDGDLALVTDEGGPLFLVDPYANGDRGRRWCKIETDLAAMKKRLGITGVSFSMFRDTSSTRIESMDPNLTDRFEGHKDGRMARFYVDGSKVDLDRMFSGLDKAIDELEAYYGLTFSKATRTRM